MQINEKLLERGGALVTRLLQSYTTKINEAFLANGEEKLSINLGLTIAPAKADGDFDLKAKIKFVGEKTEDTFTERVSEKQTTLQLEDAAEGSGKIVKCPIRVVDGIPDEMYSSFCNNKCDLRKEIVAAEGPDGPFYQSRSCSAWADEDHHAFIALQLERIDGIPAGASLTAQAQSEAPAKKKRGRKPNAEKQAA